MRTCALVCLGTLLYVRLGVALDAGHADPTRVLGQVVTGIGFLGAGLILTRDHQIVGITSAAVMWVLAAIGAAVGLDQMGTAVAVTLTVVVILVGLNRLEHTFNALRRGVHADPDEAQRRFGVRR
jgi:putative Mg2+ transporter-C (MgtC) family protein